jgi:hypothetical protein
VLENICQPVLAFSSNFFGSITHRGGRDVRVPVRAASRQLLSAAPTLGVLVLPVRFGDPVVGLRRRNRLAVGYPPYVCPPYVCQPVWAFSSNLFGSITHRGGRDARVPVRAASRLLLATPTGTVWNINTIPTPFRRGQAPVANIMRMHL